MVEFHLKLSLVFVLVNYYHILNIYLVSIVVVLSKWNIKTLKELTILKTIYLFINSSIPILLTGFVLKQKKVLLFVENINLFSIIYYIKYAQYVKTQTLIDLFGVDIIFNIKNNFIIHYILWSLYTSCRIQIVTYINLWKPLLSINSLYGSSSWLEREVWDMFGVKFLLHNDLRKILCDYGFQGFPLRKSFPLVGFVEVRYDLITRSILLEPVELQQDFRLFNFSMPWNEWKSIGYNIQEWY